jgi:hypothetical protein
MSGCANVGRIDRMSATNSDAAWYSFAKMNSDFFSEVLYFSVSRRYRDFRSSSACAHFALSPSRILFAQTFPNQLESARTRTAPPPSKAIMAAARLKMSPGVMLSAHQRERYIPPRQNCNLPGLMGGSHLTLPISRGQGSPA